MRVVKLFVFAFLAVFLSQFANAQITEPVKWEFLIEDIADDEVNLVFKAKIDEAWHLYGQNFPEGGPIPLLFEIEDNENFEFEGVVQELSELIEEYDDIFEINVSYFSGEALFKQNILLKTSEPFVIRGEVNGQACQDNGMCVPISADFAFALNGANLEDFAQDKEVEKSVKNETPVLIKENSYLDDSEKENIFWFFLIAFVSGLIAILTPCVFPMIPMTISFFMKEDNKTKAKFNAFAFGISIILIYTLIGSVLAIIFGPAIANWLSTHWIPNVLFFLIFMIFAASFFGAFDIVLPSWLVNKSDSKADRGGLIGAFFMALTLVLVSFSCTGPIVGTILVSSFGGSILKPIIGMFGFSLAFALPFTLLALFPRWLKSMPKSGGWLNTVKVVLGFIEVALGFKFLSIADQTYHWGILDRQVYLAIWIVTFTLLGFYLLGKLRFKHDDELKYISVGRLSMSMLSFV
ncbi:MAG: disulfide bond formation protein DsbD, partial [Bacteroidales bacterium]|nr:disulfide bond formation protein DsbD [Bacteroidales bacterium]